PSSCPLYFSFSNAAAPTAIYPLSLHDALPISPDPSATSNSIQPSVPVQKPCDSDCHTTDSSGSTLFGGWAVQIPCRSSSRSRLRSEEHTSELQSLTNLVCRLLLEKKNAATRSP